MYAFLSQPPPSQKTIRRVPAPLSPSRANSSAISAWASKVHPGSPSPPCSPATSCGASSPRLPALCRRNSTSVNRRPSLNHSRRSSIGQRTPSTADYHPDLTAFGYTSLFVQYDKTPSTPSPFRQRDTNIDQVKPSTPLTSEVFGSIPIPGPQAGSPVTVSAKKPRLLRPFRSFSILRSKKPKSHEKLPGSPTKSQKSNKKALKPKATAPPSLANEVALMQFMGGGTVEDNVKKVMEARSKAAYKAIGGAAKEGGASKPVEDVYRDGKGGIWYDQDEAMEYVHLLSFEDDDMEEVGSEDGASPGPPAFGILVKPPSPFTNSHCPPDTILRRTPTTFSFSSTASSTPRSSGRPSRLLLGPPSRPRRTAYRMSCVSNPGGLSSFLDLDVDDNDAFDPRSPRCPLVSFTVSTPPGTTRMKKHNRPCPTPLNLTAMQSAHARANAKALQHQQKTKEDFVTSQIADLEKARREFVEDSFRPLSQTKEFSGDVFS